MLVAYHFFFHQALFKQSFNNTAGIAHFIQHTGTYLKCTEGVLASPEDAQNIVLLRSNIIRVQHGFDFLIQPVGRINDIHRSFLVFVPEMLLLYIFFNTHSCKNR